MSQNPYEPSSADSLVSQAGHARYRTLASLLALSATLIAVRYFPLFIQLQPSSMTLFHWVAIFIPSVYLLAATGIGAIAEYRGSARTFRTLPAILAPTLLIALWIMFGFYWERNSATIRLSSLFYAGPHAIVAILAPLYFWLSVLRTRSLDVPVNE